MTPTTQHDIQAEFPDEPAAQAAAQALLASGIPHTAITITERTPERETAYLWRLVIIIVLWSILGGAVGALIGLALYATIGPEGIGGLIFQVTCWALIGHLIVGMIAGYWVLSDRTQRELTPDRTRWTLVAVVSPDRRDEVKRILSEFATSPTGASP